MCKKGALHMQNNGHTGPCIFSAKDVEIQFNLRGQTLTAVRRASLDLYEGETIEIRCIKRED